MGNGIRGFFKIINENDKYLFLSLKLSSPSELPQSIFDYFFSEEVLWRHINYRMPDLPFTSGKKTCFALYQSLHELYDWDGTSIRGDKKGKIGELFLSILLEQYFAYRCVIPKTSFLSSNNMSVYGMDADYFIPKDNCFLFGEAKVTNSLREGITEANKSLSDYAKRVSDEYDLILSKRYLEGALPQEINEKLDVFYEEGNGEEVAASFGRVCQVLDITSIGVAVFICHGEEMNDKVILQKLDKIKRTPTILGLQTKYIVISMPVGDKDSFIIALTKLIKEKAEVYGRRN